MEKKKEKWIIKKEKLSTPHRQLKWRREKASSKRGGRKSMSCRGGEKYEVAPSKGIRNLSLRGKGGVE